MTRFYINILSLLLIASTLISCGGGGNTPSSGKEITHTYMVTTPVELEVQYAATGIKNIYLNGKDWKAPAINTKVKLPEGTTTIVFKTKDTLVSGLGFYRIIHNVLEPKNAISIHYTWEEKINGKVIEKDNQTLSIGEKDNLVWTKMYTRY
ncbi:hypothetical protein [Porphyromonas levii]|uniref:hypothetical protein n=1 Tax=Porphyromonas levii TaxID=28114 RepID=UPI00035C144F|nr:hypothetical protein [Porphyromonas levii]